MRTERGHDRVKGTVPVFFSYSHRDADFVKTVALQLANNDVKVLRDGDRILPGDRFADEIQKWISLASSACIFISKHSLASEWVNREVDACIDRQSKVATFALVPVLLDDSALPPKLQERVFVDARTSIEAALPEMLSVIRSAEQASAQGKVNPWGTAYFDFGVHSEVADGAYSLELDTVSYDSQETYSILSQFVFRGIVKNVWEELGFGDPKLLQNHLLKTCAEAFAEEPAMTSVTTHKVQRGRFTLSNDSGQEIIEVTLRTSILGPGPKGAVAFNLGALFAQICSTVGIEFESGTQSRGSLGRPIVRTSESSGDTGVDAL